MISDPAVYDKIKEGDELEAVDIRGRIERDEEIIISDKTGEFSFKVNCELSERQKKMILAGGLLNYTKELAERG